VKAHIAAAAYRVPGTGPLLGDLLASRPRGEARFLTCSDPVRPEPIAAGAWRRMSRLGRLVAEVATPLLAGRADLDTIAVVWGTVFGEMGPTGQFLDRLLAEGVASPLAFQNSVYNAPVGHLSNALDLRGVSETVSAGGTTGLAALARGIDLIALGRAPAVLVLAGDVLSTGVRRSWDLLGVEDPLGEAVAGVLLDQGEGMEVTIDATGSGPAPRFARTRALPLEDPLSAIPGAIPPERCLGLMPTLGLVVVAALAEAGQAGTVVEQDGTTSLVARVVSRG